MPLQYYRIFSTFLLQPKETVLLQVAVPVLVSRQRPRGRRISYTSCLSLGSQRVGHSYTTIEVRTQLRFTVFRDERGPFRSYMPNVE
jgi:hypothetical protein